jgi:hypothetical protein
MFFLLRLAFWLTLVCLLVPNSTEDSRRLVASAAQTLKDVRGFCERNPQVCDDARTTMTSLLVKLRSGAELLQDWLAQHGQAHEGEAGSDFSQPIQPTVRKSGRNDAPQPVAKWQDSLNLSDRQVPWRGPSGF